MYVVELFSEEPRCKTVDYFSSRKKADKFVSDNFYFVRIVIGNGPAYRLKPDAKLEGYDANRQKILGSPWVVVYMTEEVVH